MNEQKQQEEGRRMTTKSATAHSSITDSHAKNKKIIDDKEEQAKTDDMQIAVGCRICADDIIFQTLVSSGFYNQLGMIAETTAKSIRSLILRAADRIGCSPSVFENTCMELFIRFREPEPFFKINMRGGNDVKD